MPQQQQKTKGNPASKRMGNAALKVRRSLSWQRSQRRKDERRKAQHERERANEMARAAGVATPWDLARAERYARRHPA